MAKKQKEVPAIDWKTFDIRKATTQDIQASVALLTMILDNPHIFEALVGAIEKWRDQMLAVEEMQKTAEVNGNGKVVEPQMQ